MCVSECFLHQHNGYTWTLQVILNEKMKRLVEILTLMAICFSAIGQDENINFQSDNLTLNGTLSIPENGNSPYPIAILVHGSGASDRNQTSTLSGGNSLCLYPDLFNQTIRNFEDIAQYLSENGIAVLRYDKRTFTHGQTLSAAEILVSDFIIDVESAIEYCQTRTELDLNNIFLIGHSQGSSLIPIAAINSESIKGLISLAGPTTPIDSLLPEQIRHIYVECANDPNTGENIANQLYQQFEQIRNGTFPLDQQISVTIPGNPTPIPQGYGSFWSNWIEISDDVIQNYTNSNIKSLIIQGEEDLNVPFTDADAFSSISNAEVIIYEGINHFLTSQDNNKVSIDILSDILNWINSCITTSTEDFNGNTNRFHIYRTGEEIIIETDDACQNCIINIYRIDGSLLKSTSMTGNNANLTVDESSLKVIVVKEKQSVFSKLIK